ncbi:MAG: PAS domain S-box protein, partial [bacterium]|nr:PAS domain S-box protein [bacterium]
YRRVFTTKTAAVTGPITDRWGVWVSALVPLTDPQTGAMLAVLGMDIDARVWNWDVAAKAALPAGLILVLLIGAATLLASASRSSATPKPILRRLLPPLTVMVILLLAGAGVLLWQQHQQQLAVEIAADIADAAGDLRATLGQQAAVLTLLVQPIAAATTVQKALRAGDAGRLLADWQPVFETLRRKNHITHFYFIATNRICLLRVHRPENRGDLINRFTAREAERTAQTASGTELGAQGTFTLRMVQPVFDGDTLVGYVELGKEIGDALNTLHTRSGNQLAVIIRKEYLNRRAWEAGMRLLGREADWNQLPSNVVIYDSQGRLPDAFTAWADDAHGHHETDREIAGIGKAWRVSATPLQDAAGIEVGDLLVMRDVSAAKAAFVRLVTLGSITGGVLLALLLGFIYLLLRRTDAGIHAQQAALRESEQSYRNQFANNSMMMLLLDPGDGAIIDANAAALRFYGYARERLLAMRITDINTLPAAEVRQAMASVLPDQGKRFQFQHRLADGSVREVETSASRIQFGARVVLHTIMQDITERTRAADELKRNEQRYKRLQELLRNIADVIPDLVWAKDLARNFIFVNKAVCEKLLCARDTDEPIGKTDMFFVTRERQSQPDNPDWHTFGEICLDSDAVVLATGATGQFDEFGNVRGQFLALEVIKTPLRDETGAIIGTVGAGRDVTARKRAEEALRESTARFQEVLENSLDASYKRNLLTDTYDYLSPVYTRIAGYTPAEMEHVSVRMLMDLIHPDDVPEVTRVLADSMANQYEYRIKHKDGHYLWILNRLKVMRDAQGTPVARIGSVSDITARKRAEAALRESEAKYRQLVEITPDWVWAINCDGVHTYSNPAVHQLLGYHASAILGTNAFPLMHPGDIHAVRAMLNRCLAQKVGWQNVTIRWLHKDGSVCTFESSASPILHADGQLVGFSGVDRDITARTRAEEALRESESLLRESQVIAGLGSYVLDIPAGVWKSSDVLDTVLGIDKSYPHSVAGWVALIHPDDRTPMADYFKSDVLGQGHMFNKEYRIIRHDDHAERWVCGVGRLEFDAQGRPLKMRGTIQDITARKQAEAELLKMHTLQSVGTLAGG